MPCGVAAEGQYEGGHVVNRSRLSKACVLICVALLVGSCVSAKSPDLPYSNQQKSNLTPGMVKKHVKVGVASQFDIATVFGAANIITRNSSGEEVWIFDRQSMASAAEVAEWNASGSVAAAAGGVVGTTPVVGGAGVGGGAGKGSSASQVSSTTFTLIVIFDENDVVKDYQMQATQF